MTNFETAQRRVKKLLYLRSLQDFLKAEEAARAPTVNTLIPQDENEEPFFVIHEIDWSKYGRINEG